MENRRRRYEARVSRPLWAGYGAQAKERLEKVGGVIVSQKADCQAVVIVFEAPEGVRLPAFSGVTVKEL